MEILIKVILIILLTIVLSCTTIHPQACESYCANSQRLQLGIWDLRCDCSNDNIKRNISLEE